MVVQPDTFPFMVIGNKADLDAQRAISTDAAKKAVMELGPGIEHIETSAKDNTNVTQAFSSLAAKALDRLGKMQKRADETGGSRRATEKERLRNARRSGQTMDSFTNAETT